MIFTSSPSFASETGDKLIEADYSFENIDGKVYKVYNFNDVMPQRTFFSFFRAVGDPLDTRYKVKVSWDAYDLTSADIKDDIRISIYDKTSKKTIAETEPINAQPNTRVDYSFYETDDWNAVGVSHDPNDWSFRTPNDVRFDVRVRSNQYGELKKGAAEVSIIQYGSSIYRAEYFTNQATKPTITVKSNNNNDDRRVVPINNENMGANDYYRFDSSTVPNRFYKGESINLIGDPGIEADAQLLISNKATADSIKMFVVNPDTGEENRQGSFIDTVNGNTPYHYIVTGDHKTAHIITVRQDLKVTFDPNGGEWVNADEGQEKLAKSYTIGHSMKLGEARGDIEAVNLPEKTEIKAPTITGPDGIIKKNELLGWNTDKDANTPMTEEELQALEFTEDTTLYAIYSELGDGKAKVIYKDNNTGAAIDINDLKIDGEAYPEEKKGSLDEAIPLDVYTKETAPKILGYKFNRVELSPEDANYTADGKSIIKIYYNKLEDVVDGNGGNTERPDGYVEVKFDLAGKGDTTEETVFYVNPNATDITGITAPTVTAKTGYKFTGWDSEVQTSYTADTTHTAQYETIEDVVVGTDPETQEPIEKPEGYVEVKFDLNNKGTTTDETVFYVNPNVIDITGVTAPKVKANTGYKFTGWNSEVKNSYTEDTTHKALYETIEDVVAGTDPDSQEPNERPEGYVKVTFLPGSNGTIVGNAVFYVNPSKEVTITAPSVTADENYQHIGRSYGVTSTTDPAKVVGTFADDTEITASYMKTSCMTKEALQEQFEEAANAKFANVGSKDGIYVGKYDAKNHKVTVAIMDESQGFGSLSGTGPVAGLTDLFEKNSLVSFKIGGQEARDLNAIWKKK